MENGQFKNMVFYRKYRPQKIDDLDNQDVRETLTAVLSQVNPPHAFLFTGPKGLGKTSSARIVAKVVNCERVSGVSKVSKVSKGQKARDTRDTRGTLDTLKNIEPCNKCESCLSIAEGTNMDILEIDAASNRGIDEIRDLREKIRLAPLSSKMKVYVIDEVHMLTTEAFNALLKTLEEPPLHAMFILCTTEAQKLPATIVSRCFHISFRKATEEELVRSFERIIKGEKLSIDKASLKFIASLSDGAFRDGVKILEEMVLIAGKNKVTKELIEEKYKVVTLNKSIDQIIVFMIAGDVKKALALVSDLIDQGVDIKYFTQSLIESLHSELLIQVQTGKSENYDLDINSIKLLVELLSNAYMEMKNAVLIQLPLELAILEWTPINADQNAEVRRNEDQQVSAFGSADISDLRKQVGNIRKIKAMYGTDKHSSVKTEEPVTGKSGITLLHTSNGDVTKEWLDEFWRNLINEMKNHNHTIAGVLRGCKIGGYDKKVLIIETQYKFHKERLDDMKTMGELSRVAKLLTGKDVKVEVQLKQ